MEAIQSFQKYMLRHGISKKLIHMENCRRKVKEETCLLRKMDEKKLPNESNWKNARKK